MKDKEKLLPSTPRLFIFHSVLREGWDNPNVFQIACCATQDGARAAVTIGRTAALRDQDGPARSRFDVNTLRP